MIAVAAMFASFVVCWLLVRRFEPRTISQVTAVFYAWAMWRFSRNLRVNTSPAVIGGLLVWAIMFAAIAAIGFWGHRICCWRGGAGG